MKVDFKQVQQVLIKNPDGEIVDAFTVTSVEFTKSQLHGNNLFLTRKKPL